MTALVGLCLTDNDGKVSKVYKESKYTTYLDPHMIASLQTGYNRFSIFPKSNTRCHRKHFMMDLLDAFMVCKTVTIDHKHF